MSVRNRRVVTATGTAAAMSLVLAACGGSDSGSDANTLTITTNAIAGGQNSEEAEWIEEWVIPEFVAAKEADGEEVSVEFEPQGVDDSDYKNMLALDIQSGGGADIFGMDGIWIGEFAQAEYIKPLNDHTTHAEFWDGWNEISEDVQRLIKFENERYGIPAGTDARVLFYNKDLFEQAGLDREWQPESWEDLLDAVRALDALDDVIPIQLNAGTAMGEATTMQGFLPFLAAAGEEIWLSGMWTGASDGVVETLGLYEEIYAGGYGDTALQQEAPGRDRSFELFADNQVGILAEGDYFWRSVVHPNAGVAPMEDRDEVVGYAMIPAVEPGGAVDGQDFSSMSGGTARVINPNTENSELAFELLAFMHSEEATMALLEREQDAGDEEDGEAGGANARITARDDVNAEVLEDDEFMTFLTEEVLPNTVYRPGVAEYPEISQLLQEATAAIVSGESAADAAAEYEDKLEEVVGGGNVTS